MLHSLVWRHRKGLPAMLAAVAAFGLAVGCSAGQGSAGTGSSPAAPGPGTVQAPSGVAESSTQVLPIFAYLETSDESMTGEQAENILVATCMRQFGYNMPDAAFVTPEPPPMYRRYGITSMAIASQWGYHLDPAGHLTTSPSPQPPLSQAEYSVFMGTKSHSLSAVQAAKKRRIIVDGKPVPAGGCLGQAGRQLHGGGTSHTLPDQINQDSFVESQNKPTVISALHAWSQCMAAHGYHVASPIAAPDRFSLKTPAPSRAEIDEADADVGCKQKTNLVGIWFAAEYKLQEAAIQKHILELNAIAQHLKLVQRTAIAVITSRQSLGR